MSQTHMGGADDWAVRDTRAQTRAFRLAKRHTRLVKILRFALPLSGALMIAAIAIKQIPAFLLLDVPISISGLSFKDGALTMENPRLTGFGRNARSYELSARAANQDILNPKIVKLDDIVARIGEDDGTTTSLTAANGTFDTDSEMLHLQKNVIIDSGNGYRMELRNAEIDLNKGVVRTGDRVQLELLDGALTANGMTVENRGEVVRFEGGVSLTLKPRNRNATDDTQ